MQLITKRRGTTELEIDDMQKHLHHLELQVSDIHQMLHKLHSKQTDIQNP